MSGLFALAGLTSGALKRFQNEHALIRFVSMDPNIPAIAVCLNEGPDHEQWYQVDFHAIDKPEGIEIAEKKTE